MAEVRPIGYWLRLVDNLIEDQFAKTLDEHGVTRMQWQLLNVLARGIATVEQLDAAVAPFVGQDDTETAVDHLSELIDSAWVDATPVGYELTERGRSALDRLTTVVTQQRTTMAEGVTEENYLTTVGTLERIARNLGWTNPD